MRSIHRHRLVFIALVAACVPLAVIAAELDPHAVAWVDKGLEIAKTQPDSDAEAECYEKAVEIAPTYANAWFNLGLVRLRQAREAGRADASLLSRRAAIAFERCIQHDPDRTDAYYNSFLALSAIPAPSGPTDSAGTANATCTDSKRILFPELAALRLRQYLGRRPNAENGAALRESLGEIEIQAARRNNADVLDFADTQTIVAKLSKSPTRGASPYAGGRVPIRILFDHDKAEIRPDQLPQLREIAAALRDARLSGDRIRIEGHTDSDGSIGYNQTLSERRARAIREHLVREAGIAPERLVSRGFGLARPLKPNDTSQNKQTNRRVELVNETREQSFLAGQTRGDTEPFYLFRPGEFPEYLEGR